MTRASIPAPQGPFFVQSGRHVNMSVVNDRDGREVCAITRVDHRQVAMTICRAMNHEWRLRPSIGDAVDEALKEGSEP